ncbi:MAG: DNA ligase [Chthoniobacterales bacterium]
MRNPPGFSVSTLGLVAGVILAWPIPAQGDQVSTGPAKVSPPLLLAKVWDPSIDPTGWWMSEKYDGLRSYWDGHQLWSRNGKAIHGPDYFLAELPPDVALDGELWIGRGKFEETSSTVLRETPDERWKRVRFMVFDAPEVKGTFEERMEFMGRTLPREGRFVQVVAQQRCEGTAQLLAERDRVVSEGGEGLMLRRPESQYEAGRSPTLLKVKPFDDAEATVLAHLPGKGRLAGKMGSLRVRTSEGKEFSIGSGFTDAQRESPPAVGSVVTYRFRGLTAKGLPRFPSFLRVRRE